MGGLVTKLLLAQFPQAFERLVTPCIRLPFMSCGLRHGCWLSLCSAGGSHALRSLLAAAAGAQLVCHRMSICRHARVLHGCATDWSSVYNRYHAACSRESHCSAVSASCMSLMSRSMCMHTGWEQYFFVQRHTMRALAVQSPAVFELLPSASHEWPAGHPVRRSCPIPIVAACPR